MKQKTIIATALIAGAAVAAEPRHTIVDDAWATTQGFRLSGRLSETHAVAAKDAGKRRTLYNTTRLLFTSGERGRVQVAAGPLRWETRADESGYWEISSNQVLSALPPGWHELESEPQASASAGLLVHDPRNTVGIISDVDDTILVSEVNRTRSLLRNSLLVPAESREAVPGMADRYRQITALNAVPEATPIFYVSASPRQLTDSVRRFLGKNGFPRGVLQLKEVRTSRGDSLTDQQAYKVRRITAVLQAFPGVRFVLFGDDGEYDPESYAELVARFPAQISEVWIRRVNPDPLRVRHPGQKEL
ncbi:MAG: hypothetical protein RLZZ618_2864 [Pseudomonadota bacterium]|jgi:phosphatidate phosphatase APP1